MRQTTPPFLVPPAVNISLWFALSSALVAFAIISQNLLFTLSIAAGSLFIRCLSPALSRRIHYTARFAFTFAAYLAAIIPLWPESLTDYYGLPLLLALAIPLIAALNQHSDGGSRGFTSIVTVAFLLFARNIILYFDFEAPIQELTLAISFISLMEIALSIRYLKGNDSPHPELVFGLLLALISSFHLESLPLALVLTALPITAFLLRNYQLAKIANEHARPAQSLSHRPPARNITLHLALLTLLPFAALLYLLALRIPFWADSLPRNAPYLAKEIAKKATVISDASDLENDSLESLANTIMDQDFIAEKSSQLVQSLEPEPKEDKANVPHPISESPRHEIPNTKTGANPRPSDERDSSPSDLHLGNFAQNVAPNSLIKPPTIGALSQESITLPKHASVTPPRVSLATSIPNNLLPLSEQTSPTTKATTSAEELFDTDLTPFLNPKKNRDESGNFDRFLDTFGQPEQAIARSLNLQGSDVRALLDEKPLIIVTLDKSRNSPRRLYLRSNVLDTISSNGVDAIRDANNRIELSATNNGMLNLPSFRLSKSDGERITVTSDQSRNPTLPLPESLSQIEILGTDTIQVYPEERVALLPYTQEPVTYRIYDADLEISERERSKADLSENYLQRMLEVPLRKADRNTLNSLAKRIGGSRTSTQAFAARVSNYFENKHPYSYFVEIPDGPGHAVVRWLENECPGLCSNYAAAFTLLARSRGIPSRVVSGFATDEFSPPDKRYTFRQSNAHAWVEYLDESNTWVRFDPTPGITETELRRAQPYATAAMPESLNQLIESEKRSLTQQKQTEQQKADADQIADNPAPPAIEEKPDTEPSPAPFAKAIPPSPTPLPDVPDNTPYPLNKPTTAPKSKPATVTTVAEAQPAAPPTTTPKSPVSNLKSLPTPEDDPSSSPSTTRPPWLLLLSLLALGVPACLYFLRLKSAKKATSPQLRLRHKAGRLLNQLDTLIQLHHLENDPVWSDTRHTLSAQRYGRETNAILIQDIAIKISLLAKKR